MSLVRAYTENQALVDLVEETLNRIESDSEIVQSKVFKTTTHVFMVDGPLRSIINVCKVLGHSNSATMLAWADGKDSPDLCTKIAALKQMKTQLLRF